MENGRQIVILGPIGGASHLLHLQYFINPYPSPATAANVVAARRSQRAFLGNPPHFGNSRWTSFPPTTSCGHSPRLSISRVAHLSTILCISTVTAAVSILRARSFASAPRKSWSCWGIRLVPDSEAVRVGILSALLSFGLDLSFPASIFAAQTYGVFAMHFRRAIS